MSKVLVLGAAGAVGRVCAKTLALHDAFDEVVFADLAIDEARRVVDELGLPGTTAQHIDVDKGGEVRAAAEGCDVVVNCTGPFYRFAIPVLEETLAAGVDYLDVCDDVDATLALLDKHDEVKGLGRQAVIGMGNSPGVTNLLARFASEQLLDETIAADFFHAHGGEAFEGAGVVAHRFHGMGMEIPMYLDGELKYVRFFGDDGMALRTKVQMHLVGDAVPVYPYPHPEQVTIPRHLKLQQVTNRGTVLPDEYFDLTVEMARLGLTSQEPLDVGGKSVTPRDFSIAYLLKRRDEILKDVDFGAQRGCTKVVVRGTRRGEPRTYQFSLASTDQALGEGTGIPAAMGAILMKQGKVHGHGVLPPEACMNPIDFLALVGPVLALDPQGGSFEGVLVEQVDADGTIKKIDLPI